MTSEPNESSEEAGAPPAGTAESLTRPGAAPGHDVSRAIGPAMSRTTASAALSPVYSFSVNHSLPGGKLRFEG